MKINIRIGGIISVCLLLMNCKSITISQKIDVNKVVVLGINDSVSERAQLKSEIKIGYFPPYLSLYKNYDSIINAAKQKAAEAGGNQLKIISHTPYQYNIGKAEVTLHKIKAKVYYSEDKKIVFNGSHNNQDKAKLNFYMFYQGVASKNLYINDSVVTEMKSGSKYTYTVNQLGDFKLRCGNKGISMVINVSTNKDYYLKCNIKLGLIKNTSFIEQKDSIIGAKEFNSL